MGFARRSRSGIRPVVPSPDPRDLSPVERDYAHYLVHARGLTQASTRAHLFHVHRLLSESFGSKPIRLAQLRQHHITRYILRHAPAYKARSAQTWMSALRGFVRFLNLRGKTRTDLSGCVLKAAHWNLSTIPKYIEAPKVEQLLNTVDRSTPAGLRDYAILLLLARLGLRGGEIVKMELEDLHWDTGELAVRGKNSRWGHMPIPEDVGVAIVEYLRRARPRCPTRKVFIRLSAPRRGFLSSAAVTSLVAHYLDLAGIHAARKGAHVLRHSLATRMLRQGGSLEEICQVLRHVHLSTTEIYAKVDVSALRELAQPWPGSKP